LAPAFREVSQTVQNHAEGGLKQLGGLVHLREFAGRRHLKCNQVPGGWVVSILFQGTALVDLRGGSTENGGQNEEIE
jgi:hypothetical protein